jgi:hypothetical protein
MSNHYYLSLHWNYNGNAILPRHGVEWAIFSITIATTGNIIGRRDLASRSVRLILRRAVPSTMCVVNSDLRLGVDSVANYLTILIDRMDSSRDCLETTTHAYFLIGHSE